MKAAYVLVTGVGLLLISLLIQAQETPPPQQLSTPATAAIASWVSPSPALIATFTGKT